LHCSLFTASQRHSSFGIFSPANPRCAPRSADQIQLDSIFVGRIPVVAMAAAAIAQRLQLLEPRIAQRHHGNASWPPFRPPGNNFVIDTIQSNSRRGAARLLTTYRV